METTRRGDQKTMTRGYDVAYAAGVIDSDGTIGVFYKKGPNDCYEPRVGVRQVEPQAIDLLKELFGGSRRDAYHHGGPNCRPLYEWRATARVAVAALVEVLPYLKIKREQANNAIEVGKLNAQQKFRQPLVFDDSEGMVTLSEAAQVIGKSRGALTNAISRGQLPAVGWRASRRVPLATAREWSKRRPGGPTRTPERTAELHRRFLLAKELNKVGAA